MDPRSKPAARRRPCENRRWEWIEKAASELRVPQNSKLHAFLGSLSVCGTLRICNLHISDEDKNVSFALLLERLPACAPQPGRAPWIRAGSLLPRKPRIVDAAPAALI